VRVQFPFGQLSRNWRGDIIKFARQDGVFAKGLGLLDEGTVSRLYG
jgi:hypothetical protein